MSYDVLFEERSLKSLKKIVKHQARILYNWIKKNLDGCIEPRRHGKALKGNLSEYWRYRVGMYRIIAQIDDMQIKIIIINVAHRREVYTIVSK
jgi:mRNA interferase RelE/StbE